VLANLAERASPGGDDEDPVSSPDGV
jgi:hypothetical protein